MTTKAHPESAVRAYINYLEDPASLVDTSAIDELTQLLAQTSDPIDRLRLAQRIEAAENPSGDALRDAFVRTAKAWAESEGLTSASFTRLGIPEVDLKAAGFRITKRANQHTKGAKRRVSIVDIAANLPSEPFTTRQLQEHSGAAMMTVRRAISELLGTETITKVGPQLDYTGPGKPPTVYKA